MMRKIYTPLTEKQVELLKAGDEVLLSGVIYTMRDRAHARMVKEIKKKRLLPFSLHNQVIYYCGPTPAKPGRVIGSCGPTTSSRMDAFTVPLLKKGLKGMIGKGKRSPQVRQAIKRYKAVYFLTIGGAGAYLSGKVKQAQVLAYHSFGPEAVYRLLVENFPLIVGIDCGGRDALRRSSK